MSTPPGPQDPQDPQPNGYGQTPPPPAGYGQPSGAPAYGGPPGAPAYGGPPSAPPPSAGYGSGYGGSTGTEANSLGVWALVLGIVSFLCSLGFLTGIPAIILGNKSKRAAAEGRANNGGLGTVGLILGWIATVLSLLLLVALVVLVANGDWDALLREWETGYSTGSDF